MTGTTLGPYRILEELGRGGMGIVYKAEDTKLERQVALKVLPAAALASQDDRARFYREAKAAAALNHPNIAAIHQIDEAIAVDADGNQVEASDGPRPFIAMEFIEGGSLEERIQAGPLKLDEAVRIATQVAEAMKAAHAKEIVHRDIKSANIMLTKDGQAKVLDFGLAQTNASTKLTRMGSTLGTVAYMSPEQARGEEVDGRSDLYSLGTVLYEMIAGHVPFGGEYEQAVVYSILNADPEPLTALRTGVPMELERITGKLLAKEASRRYQTAADLIADLEGVEDQVHSGSTHSTVMSGIHSGVHAAAEPAAPSLPKPWILAAAGVLLLALGWSASSMFAPEAAPAPVERLQIRIDGMRYISTVGISPDERYFALTGYDWEGNEGLFFYDLREGSLRHVDRSEGAAYPWFSPSGDRVAFSINEGNTMYVVEVPSGTPKLVQEQSWTSYWVDEDRLLFTFEVESGFSDQIWRRGANYFLSLSEDSLYVIHGTEYKESETTAQWYFPGPRIPGTNYMLGNMQGVGSFGLDPKLYLIDIKERTLHQTEHGGINPQPLTSDILLYQIGDDAGPLVARRFDPDNAVFTSPSVEVHEGAFFGYFQTNPHTGSLLIAETNLPNRQIVSVMDTEAETVKHYELPTESGQVFNAALDEARERFVYSLTNGENGRSQVVTMDLATGSERVTLSDVPLLVEAVTDDGFLYALSYSVENGSINDQMVLTRRSLFGSQRPDTLSEALAFLSFGGFSRKGVVVGTGDAIGVLDPETRAFSPLVESAGSDTDVSPDGRYVVFQLPTGVHAILDLETDAITSLPEINGGWPAWAPDGSALYYVSFDDVPAGTNEQGEVMRLPVRLSPSFQRAGSPEFVGHTLFPVDLMVAEEGPIMFGQGEMTANRPERTSTYVTWWRNLGAKLDAELPR